MVLGGKGGLEGGRRGGGVFFSGGNGGARSVENVGRGGI